MLLCAAGVGFVGTASVAALAVSPVGPEGRKPLLRLAGAEEFPEPVVCSFPSSGPHPILGFEPKALSAGLLTIPQKGYLHVYDRAWGLSEPRKHLLKLPIKKAPEKTKTRMVVGGRALSRRRHQSRPSQSRPSQSRPSQSRPSLGRPAEPVVSAAPGDGKPVHTGAGRHAMMEYENEKVRWTFWGKVARLFFGDGLASRYADKRVEKAEKTWGAGARAEVAVGGRAREPEKAWFRPGPRSSGAGYREHRPRGHRSPGNLRHRDQESPGSCERRRK